MPPVIAGIVAGLAVVGAGYTVGAAIALGVLVAGVTYASTPDIPDLPGQSGPQVGQASARGILLNDASNTAPINPIYGARRVGGNTVFREITGNTNKRLHIVQVLGEGPISAVQNVLFNDKQVVFNKDTYQRDVLHFQGVVDRSLTFSMRVVEAPGVSGLYSGQYGDIAKAYSEDGGTFTPIAQQKIGTEPWYEGNLDFFPLDEALIDADTVAVVNAVNEKETDALGSIQQVPSAANNWVCKIHISEPSEGIQRVEFKIRVVLRKKEPSPDLSVNPFENINLSGYQNWLGGRGGTILGGFRARSVEELPDPSYSTSSEVYTVLGNQHLGNSKSAADEEVLALLRSRFPELMPESSKFHRMAMLYAVLDFDPDVYQGVPRITADVIGAEYLIDPRAIVAGWSENPIVCLYDFLTDKIYGCGIPPEDINAESFIEEANYCDESVSIGSFANQKRYTCNGIPDINATLKTGIERILSSCRGMLLYVGGQWVVKIDKPEAVSGFTFSADNIVGGWQIDIGGKDSKYNSIDANYFNPDANWESDVLPLVDDNFLAEDNGTINKKSLDLPFTAEKWRVDALARIELNVSRFPKVCSFDATIAALDLVVADIVKVTHDTPGWVDKPFRVAALTIKPEGLVNVTLREYDSGAYNITSPVLIPTSPRTTLPDVLNIPAPSYITMDSGWEQALVMEDGTIVNRLYVEFGAVPFADFYEVQWKPAGAGAWQQRTSPETQTYISDVKIRNYLVRVRGVTGFGSRSPWRNSDEHLIVGYDRKPDDVESLTFAMQPDGYRRYEWSTIDHPLIAGYQLRIGASADWENMTPLHSGLLTESPHISAEWPPGNWHVGVKAVLRNYLISENAKYTEAVLTDNLFSDGSVWIIPKLAGWPGTLTNCQVDSDGLAANSSDTWADISSWNDWTSWGQNPETQIIYEYGPYDMGASVTFTPQLDAFTDSTAVMEISVSADGVSYDAYHTVSGTETARYWKVRTTVDQAASEVPRITNLSFYMS
ncbi:MAG: hypothetical protein AAF542_17810 [Pseudomonadota bacterium]